MPVAYGLIDPHDLALPALPDALNGFRIAHLSDMHTFKEAAWHRRLADQLARHRFDLLVITGDLMHRGRDQEIALEALETILKGVRHDVPRIGVFGNHDDPEFRDAARGLRISWLENEAIRLTSVPVDVMGLNTEFSGRPVIGDHVEVARVWGRTLQEPAPVINEPAVSTSASKPNGSNQRLRILLTHRPDAVTLAHDLDIPLAFAGHTHGGQIRLPSGRPMTSRCNVPASCATGVVRHRDTLVAISRGLGQGPWAPRIMCPPHMPVYTLRRKTSPGTTTDLYRRVVKW